MPDSTISVSHKTLDLFNILKIKHEAIKNKRVDQDAFVFELLRVYGKKVIK